ncbi:unnamed protein product [Cuscuta europaea]|uniref:Uncharacterized protein n=1 Tax=Cuscuta europaea TaxID=41803 RepID=A0A9P0YL33_CUSEU|nr:unnamed protein product [Cuscuta europaea]
MRKLGFTPVHLQRGYLQFIAAPPHHPKLLLPYLSLFRVASPPDLRLASPRRPDLRLASLSRSLPCLTVQVAVQLRRRPPPSISSAAAAMPLGNLSKQFHHWKHRTISFLSCSAIKLLLSEFIVYLLSIIELLFEIIVCLLTT